MKSTEAIKALEEMDAQIIDSKNRIFKRIADTIRELDKTNEDYWMLRGFARYICDLNIACDREPCSCDQTSLCITEWCEPCIAKAWLQDQKSKEKIVNPKMATVNKYGHQIGDTCGNCGCVIDRIGCGCNPPDA